MSFRIAFENLADGAALTTQTTSGSAMAAPISNVKSHYRARHARTLAGNDWLDIKVDFGAAKTVTDVVLWRHNLVGDDATGLTLYSGENQTGSIVASLPAAPRFAYADRNGVAGYAWDVFSFPATACRSALISMSGLAGGFVQLNRLFIGRSIEFDTPQDWGSVLLRKPAGQIERTEGGSVVAPPPAAPSHRELTLPFSFLLDAERDYSMIGRLAGQGGGTALAYARWGDRLVIQEI